MTGGRAALAGAAVLALVAGVVALQDDAAPAAVPSPTTPPSTPRLDAGSPDAASAEGPRPAPPPSPGDRFCAPGDYDSGSISSPFTLGRLLTEAQRGEGPDPMPAVALREALRGRPAPGALLQRAFEASSRYPGSAVAQILVAFAAAEAGRPDDHLLALRRARALAPQQPAVAWALALATRTEPDLDEPIDALASYLETDPRPEVARLRARLEVQRDLQRGYRRQSRNGLTLLWPPGPQVKAEQVDLVAATVDRALDDAAALTGTPRRHRLTVVVYPGRSELLAVSCTRAWAGGLYDGVLRLVADPPQALAAATIRHETLHAQLGDARTPYWFDEGLAQSFAREPVPVRTWQRMLRSRTWAPFGSLDESFSALEASADAELVYAQSYAMVELMRELGGDGSVAVALAAFRAGEGTERALARACGRPEPVSGEDLLAFLARRLERVPR